MKISDMLISMIIKKGILYEVRNCDLEFDIPISEISGEEEVPDKKIKIRVKAEHMTLKIDKE